MAQLGGCLRTTDTLHIVVQENQLVHRLFFTLDDSVELFRKDLDCYLSTEGLVTSDAKLADLSLHRHDVEDLVVNDEDRGSFFVAILLRIFFRRGEFAPIS